MRALLSEAVRRRFCTDLYRLRRLALIRRKWQPVGVVGFGPASGAWLREWRDSPFEDAGIADLIADRP